MLRAQEDSTRTYRKRARRYQGTKVAAPKRLEWEIIGHFLDMMSTRN